MHSVWDFKEYDNAAAGLISRELGLSMLTARLLVQRGIADAAQARDFLNAGLEKISPPLLMQGMTAAVERITQAVAAQEKIIIYGDYDVDGICSIVIMLECLQMLGGTVDYFVPDRFREGYGINKTALQALARQGCQLLITVDCGITAVEEIAEAALWGMDVIITDHHTPPDELPPAIAIVNPRLDSKTTCAELAGAGVAFKLALALGLNRVPVSARREWLELAALATIADLVPLTGENRIIVRHGLRNLSQTRRPGLRALLREVGLEDKPIGSWQVGFILAPRLNSAGRMESARISIELLICKDKSQAAAGALRLCQINDQRRAIEEKVFEEARAQAETVLGTTCSEVLVVGGEEWHLGVIGIVASRLADTFSRPVIVISWAGEEGRGSARSIGQYDIYAALQRARDFLVEFGGHRAAAGLSIKRSQLNGFTDFLQICGDPAARSAMGEKHYQADLEIEAGDINHEFMKEIEMLQPFGEGNPPPHFVLRAVSLSNLNWVGKNREHLKFNTGIDGVGGIAFRHVETVNYPLWSCGQDLLFELDRNDYGGTRRLQLKVKDIQASFLTNRAETGNSNFQLLLDTARDAAEELGAGHPVLFVYPSYRSLIKHQAIMEYFFQPSNLEPLHGHLQSRYRLQAQEHLVQGRPRIFLITRAFMRYYRQCGLNLPRNLQRVTYMWPISEPEPGLFSGSETELLSLGFKQRLRLCACTESEEVKPRTLVYANLPRTVERWQEGKSPVFVESGLQDIQLRQAVRRCYMDAGRGVFLCDGTHTPGHPYVDNIDELVLADSPLGFYELAAMVDYLPDDTEMKVGVGFGPGALEVNRQYLKRLYPEQATVADVWGILLEHKTAVEKYRPELRGRVISRILQDKYSPLEIQAVLRILADLGLYQVEKSGSISAINLWEAELTAPRMAASPYYMEGMAEKEILSDWEMQLCRSLGW